VPPTRLFNGYAAFAHVQWCYEVRDGYRRGYISDPELERARKAVKAIVAQTTKEDATINTDDIWAQALRRMAPERKPN